MVWEKKATPEEEEKAKSLQLPPTFFCGLGTADSDTDHDKTGDFDTEIRQAQQELVKEFCAGCLKLSCQICCFLIFVFFLAV